jgi:hypothetical protein
LLVAVGVFGIGLWVLKAQETNNRVIPLVVMDGVPLIDAIQNLARQAEMNVIIDPRVEQMLGPDGRKPNINGRWEDMSAQQVLSYVLSSNQLVVVNTGLMSVARITLTNPPPVNPTKLPVQDTNVIPLIQMSEVGLEDAIKRFAEQAQLKIYFDPKLLDRSTPEGRDFRLASVSVRWQNLTAGQALSVLLNNYDLILIEDSARSAYRVTRRSQSTEPSSDKADSK